MAVSMEVNDDGLSDLYIHLTAISTLYTTDFIY